MFHIYCAFGYVVNLAFCVVQANGGLFSDASHLQDKPGSSSSSQGVAQFKNPPSHFSKSSTSPLHMNGDTGNHHNAYPAHDGISRPDARGDMAAKESSSHGGMSALSNMSRATVAGLRPEGSSGSLAISLEDCRHFMNPIILEHAKHRRKHDIGVPARVQENLRAFLSDEVCESFAGKISEVANQLRDRLAGSAGGDGGVEVHPNAPQLLQELHPPATFSQSDMRPPQGDNPNELQSAPKSSMSPTPMQKDVPTAPKAMLNSDRVRILEHFLLHSPSNEKVFGVSGRDTSSSLPHGSLAEDSRVHVRRRTSDTLPEIPRVNPSVSTLPRNQLPKDKIILQAEPMQKAASGTPKDPHSVGTSIPTERRPSFSDMNPITRSSARRDLSPERQSRARRRSYARDRLSPSPPPSPPRPSKHRLPSHRDSTDEWRRGRNPHSPDHRPKSQYRSISPVSRANRRLSYTPRSPARRRSPSPYFRQPNRQRAYVRHRSPSPERPTHDTRIRDTHIRRSSNHIQHSHQTPPLSIPKPPPSIPPERHEQPVSFEPMEVDRSPNQNMKTPAPEAPPTTPVERTTLPCHNVPGLWCVKTGLDHADILECVFDVDVETATKWRLKTKYVLSLRLQSRC